MAARVSCPDDVQIRSYALGTLSAKDNWVKGHVSGCPACAGKLMRVGLTTQGETKDVPPPAPLKPPAPPTASIPQPRSGLPGVAGAAMRKHVPKTDTLPKG